MELLVIIIIIIYFITFFVWILLIVSNLFVCVEEGKGELEHNTNT